MLKSICCIMATLSAALSVVMAPAASAEQEDPYRWLEAVEGAAALDWVRGQNERTQTALEVDPRFQSMQAQALSVLTSDARLPLGAIHNGHVYNFWQDQNNVRGLWRRASVDGYRTGAPEWETLIDFDALAASEGRNWVKGDIVCLSPAYVHCMVELSDGGKDAGLWREFNTADKNFPAGGFFLPEAKSSVAWDDANTLLVATDSGDDALTVSGYPRRVQKLGRRAALASAPVLFAGETSDVAVQPQAFHDDGDTHVFITRAVTFFENEFYYVHDGGALTKLPLPLNADLKGVLNGQAIFLLREDWPFAGATYAKGSVVAYDLALEDIKAQLSEPVGGFIAANDAAELVFASTPAQSVEQVAIGEASIIVQYLDDVSGKAVRLTRNEKKQAWFAKKITGPANGVVKIISAGGGTDNILFTYESLTAPNSLYFVDARNRVEKIMETPPFYDATGVVVEQRFATSADGTKIPYYIMGRDAVLKQGNAPTVQYGYGGFLISTLPYYYEDPARPQHGALAGLLWVQRGGVLVLSNIRGGGEYGPRWHQAALKENRQRAFDDFIAISEDLIASGVTSPEKLGAIGRSNGGLLMGVMLTQRPDLYAALDIGVPLLDMKRYNKLLAGASWMGEYGDPDLREEWAYISAYSPYQNLKPGEPYPKVLLYTSTKDDRVHPGHARKAAAKLAALGYGFYYYENIEGGHGGTANQAQLAYRTALEYAYFAKMLMPSDDEAAE